MMHVFRIHMILLFAAVLSGCDGKTDGDRFIGYAEAEYVYVAPPEAGWLTEAPVREGDVVAVGDLLFSLDDERQLALLRAAEGRAAQAVAEAADIETGARPAEIEALAAQLAEANARLVQAKSERDRWMPLVREGNASKARGDQVTADYAAALARVKAGREAITVAELGGRDARRDAAKAGQMSADGSLAEAAWRLDERRVRTKVAGRVAAVYHRKGEFVVAGAPVMAVLPDGGIKVRFFVPQEALPRLSVGANVRISADGLPAPVDARISYIAPEAEFTPPVIYSADSRGKLVFMVEAFPVARVGESGVLRPGLPVEVTAP